MGDEGVVGEGFEVDVIDQISTGNNHIDNSPSTGCIGTGTSVGDIRGYDSAFEELNKETVGYFLRFPIEIANNQPR